MALTAREGASLRRKLRRRMPSSRRARLALSVKAPRAAQLRYTRDLVGLVERMRALAMPRLEAAVTREAARLDADDIPLSQVVRGLRFEMGELVRVDAIDGMVEAASAVTNAHNAREMRRVIGVSVMDAPGMAAELKDFRKTSVALIKSIPVELLDGVEDVLLGSRGKRVEVVMKLLRGRFDVTKSRAALIARDQVNSLNGKITKHRQIAAGITGYIWTASGDERVRPEHADLDGTPHEWANPPVLEAGPAHPSEEIQCRCVATPDTSKLFADYEA